MELLSVPPDVAEAGLRTLKTVCASDGELSSLEVQFLNAVQTHILHSSVDVASLTPIMPAELATKVPAREFRERIVRAAIIAASIDGEMDEREVALIEQFATALGVDLAPVRTAWKLAKDQMLLARIDIVRRSMIGVKVRQNVREEGVFATVKQFFPMLGHGDPQLTARYRALGDYPAGTLGKVYFDFIVGNQFSFPGEVNAGPEIIVLHDCMHVLGGFGTSPAAEIEVSSFQAGCTSQDPIYGLLFGLAQYHLGVQVAPVAPSEKMHADPEAMMKAFARGCRVKRDMWSDFRPWDHFATPLDEVRRSLGIEP